MGEHVNAEIRLCCSLSIELKDLVHLCSTWKFFKISPWVLRKCAWIWTCLWPYTSEVTSTWKVAGVQVIIRPLITQFCIRFDFTLYFSLPFGSQSRLQHYLCSYPGCVILCRDLVVVDRWPGQPFDVTWSYTNASSVGWAMAREQWLIARDVPSPAALAVASFKWLDYILITSPLKNVIEWGRWLKRFLWPG